MVSRLHPAHVSWQLSEAWVATFGLRTARLTRRLNGEQLELPARTLDVALKTPHASAVGKELIQRGAIRSFDAAARVRTLGQGALHALAQRLLRDGGWRLPTLVFPDRIADRPTRGAGTTVLPSRSGLLLTNHATTCTSCLVLRELGVSLPGGQTARWSELLTVAEATAKMLLYEAFLAIQRGAPGPREAIVVGAENVTRGRVLTHPDCPLCSRPRSGMQLRRELISALRRSSARPAQSGIREGFVAGPVAPLGLQEWSGPPGRSPAEPFVWGSVSLVRADGVYAHSVSTPGGVSAFASTPERARFIGLAEGVERLGARGARPEKWLKPGGQARAVKVQDLFSSAVPSHALRPHCLAIDLVDLRDHWVPFEAAVTGYPAALDPGASHHEAFYTGTACHDTLSQAVLHGTLELLKRDAFMIAWYRRLPLRRLAWPRRLGAVARRRAEHLARHGIDVEVFDLRIDFPLPTLLLRATARRRVGNWPRNGSMLVACGGFDGEEALEDGLRLLGGQHLSIALNPSPLQDPLNPTAVKRMSRLLDYWPLMARYLDPKNRHSHAFLDRAPDASFESLRALRASSTRARLSLLRRWFHERDLRWLVLRLTDPATEAGGFEVARVVLPGLMLPSPSRSTVDLQSGRLRRSWPGATERALHPDPHPAF